jgi:hypothetical protein
MMLPMKVARGRPAHEGARPAWRPRPVWLWMLAFRRRHHEEIAIVLSDFDTTERHIAELCAKAVEQLGSDQASVRSGGLYALERLAQDNPAHRQAIVNVICAYLRTPFSPTAPASKPEPGASEGQKEPGTESETGTAGIGDTWQQERRVRLTAQRILAEHLRGNRAKDHQSTDPPSSGFWNNICLDLTGATLVDFNLVNGLIADASFRRAAFSRDASFSGTTFSGDASFSGAAFSGDASFSGTTFSGDASFSGTTFTGDASFSEAAFSSDALFGDATFGRSAGFRKATFGRSAGFRKATFGGDAWFDKATFGGHTSFDKATFGGHAWFGRTTFTGDAWFDKAAFGRGASFGEATFTGGAWFGEVTFDGDAGFGRTAFGGDAWFGRAAFGRGASFDEATFDGDAWFDRAAFSRGASFDEATFDGDAGFVEAAFGGGAWFGEAAFSGGADALHFEQARVLSPGASHVWPTGWQLADADGGGYTVVRANNNGGSLAAGQTCAAAEAALDLVTLPGSSRRAQRDCAGRRLGTPEAREDVSFWPSTRGAQVLILIRVDLAWCMGRGSRAQWSAGRRAYARRPSPCRQGRGPAPARFVRRTHDGNGDGCGRGGVRPGWSSAREGRR